MYKRQVGKLAKAAEISAAKPAIVQPSETQILAAEQLNETLSTLTESIKTMSLTSTKQTEVTSKLAEAVAKQTIVQQVIQPQPQPQVFAGKLRVNDPQETVSTSQLHQEIEGIKAAVEMLPSAKPSDEPIIKLALETAAINKSATKAQIERQAKTAVSAKPTTSEVVISAETQSEKPVVETLRDANNRVAKFLTNQNRPVRRRSAA